MTTLNELRTLAEIYVENKVKENSEKTERFKVKNLLFASTGFGDINVENCEIRVTGTNEITVNVDMPITVFRAWKKYQDDFYNNNK